MYKLTVDQMAIMLSYWLSWTFDKKFLANISKETLDRLLKEFNEYEIEVKPLVDAQTMLFAWAYYFDNQDLLTPEIQDQLEELE